MSFRSLRMFPWRVTCLVLILGCSLTPLRGEAPKERRVSRVFYQEDQSRTLRWADLYLGDKLRLGTSSVVQGFPTLDPKRQTLVQMEASNGMILVGVRDDDDGEFQSGWVLIDTGVEEEVHGDHSHWRYPRTPKVRAFQLDDQQGNPAHLYCYDGIFYVANDHRNGFTRLNPGEIQPNETSASIPSKAKFHQGGGGHITMAATSKSLAFSSWIDREGPNKGRVDITLLRPSGNAKILGSIVLPHGGIHGATQNQGKVFFAPSDGICWIQVPSGTLGDPSRLKVEHRSLGKDGERPRRTGAFATMNRYVAFTTGSAQEAALYFLDASQRSPEVTRIPIEMAEGNRPSGLELARSRDGRSYAFLFHDHPKETEAPNRLSLIDMDPNLDGNWKDAKLVQELEVGNANLEGHGGHHSLSVDGDRRRALFTNPGDGTLAVLALDEKKIVGQFEVGGSPSKIVAMGGRESRSE